jgi:hypothetical protein
MSCWVIAGTDSTLLLPRWSGGITVSQSGWTHPCSQPCEVHGWSWRVLICLSVSSWTAWHLARKHPSIVEWLVGTFVDAFLRLLLSCPHLA